MTPAAGFYVIRRGVLEYGPGQLSDAVCARRVAGELVSFHGGGTAYVFNVDDRGTVWFLGRAGFAPGLGLPGEHGRFVWECVTTLHAQTCLDARQCFGDATSRVTA